VRLACLVAVGAALRLCGISFGLPFVFSFDEPTSVGEALGLIRGTTDALSFANPPLYKYLLVGLFSTIVGQPRLADVDQTLLFFIARVTSAVLGTATVVVVYWIARMLRGHQTGLIAAGLAAVTYLFVRESHFGVNDALAGLCATVALGTCIQIACRGRRRDYLAAGAALGLAFAAKYQAAVVLVPLLLAHVQGGRRRHDVDLLLGLGVALVSAIVAFPPMVTELRRVISDIYVILVLPSRLGFEGLDHSGAYIFYVKALLLGVGWPMLALALVGLVLALVRRDWPVLVLASLPISLYAVMGTSHMFVARYLLPGLPSLIVLASIVLSDIYRRFPIAAVGLAALVLAGTLPNSLQFDWLLTRTDTRTAARAWIQTHIPSSAPVSVEAPPIGPPLDQLPLNLVFPNGRAQYDLDLDDYRRQGIQYIVTSSYSAEAPNLDVARDAHRRAFYAALARDTTQVAEFVPYHGPEPDFIYDRVYGPYDSLGDFDLPGPTIRIFQLGPAAANQSDVGEHSPARSL
jgi:hypothetical protein